MKEREPDRLKTIGKFAVRISPVLIFLAAGLSADTNQKPVTELSNETNLPQAIPTPCRPGDEYCIDHSGSCRLGDPACYNWDPGCKLACEEYDSQGRCTYLGCVPATEKLTPQVTQYSEKTNRAN